MKHLLVVLLLGAVPALSALWPSHGSRGTDYQNWFSSFAMPADGAPDTYPLPPAQPAPAATFQYDWSGWILNGGETALVSPLLFPPPVGLVEIVFLGESSAYLNEWGVRIDGEDLSLSETIESTGEARDPMFGDYTNIRLPPSASFDFWFRFRPDRPAAGGGAPETEPATYVLYDPRWNTPATTTPQSYYGVLIPFGSALPYWDFNPFTIVGFEEVPGGGDGDYNDLVFAYRTWGFDIPIGRSVPEPSAFGLLGVATLLALLGRRAGGPRSESSRLRRVDANEG